MTNAVLNQQIDDILNNWDRNRRFTASGIAHIIYGRAPTKREIRDVGQRLSYKRSHLEAQDYKIICYIAKRGIGQKGYYELHDKDTMLSDYTLKTVNFNTPKEWKPSIQNIPQEFPKIDNAFNALSSGNIFSVVQLCISAYEENYNETQYSRVSKFVRKKIISGEVSKVNTKIPRTEKGRMQHAFIKN